MCDRAGLLDGVPLVGGVLGNRPVPADLRCVHGGVGTRGEYPPDKAARIAGTKLDGPNSRGESAQVEEHWIAAPPRQVSDFGRVKGK